MLTDYFRYINFRQSSFPGFYVISFRKNSYYACAYGSRFRGKMQITELMKSLRTFPKYRATDFDFHHIVERPHLADISCSGATVDESYSGMPSIMIHKGEHNRYNMILRAGETRELYMRSGQNLPVGVAESERKVREMLADNKDSAKAEIGKRIEILKHIYQGVYEENDVLQIVSMNILNDYRNRLSKL